MSLLTDIWRQMASLGAARFRALLAELALIAAIGLCLMAAAVFGLQALHGVLRSMVGPIGASALLAGLLLIVALVLALWLSERRRRQARVVPLTVPHPDPAPETAEPAVDLGTSAAFLAGFLLARRLF